MEDKDVQELETYAQFCNDTYGFTCSTLCVLYEQKDYISLMFHKAVKKEITWHLKNFRENSKLTKKEKTRIDTWEELEWIN